MKNRLKILLSFVIAFIMVSCSGLKTDTGYYGVRCGHDKITLDGDTFGIRLIINDSVLMVCSYPGWDTPNYLIMRESTGLYYVLATGEIMTTIENNSNLIGIDNSRIFDMSTKKEFPLKCDMTYLWYIGEWKDMSVFVNSDSLFFSDGKGIAMQNDVCCKITNSDSLITFLKGVQKLDVPYEVLHNLKPCKPLTDNSAKRIIINNYITPDYEVGDDAKGFCINVDVPNGNTKSDNAIRKWMLGAIKDDAFILLGDPRDITDGKTSSVPDFQRSLDIYSNLWVKLWRNGDHDPFYDRMNVSVLARKIVDCNDYITYYYSVSTYSGGMHDLPRSYYITYDKHRELLLTEKNVVKPSMSKKFKEEAISALKDVYDEKVGEFVPWDEYMNAIFSFHGIGSDLSIPNGLESFFTHQYPCDEWSGWGAVENEEFTESNFPLPHMALLPEGIVITYHPYQIDCFAAGEYHALIPYSKVSDYLQYNYHEMPELFPKLEQFIIR